MLGASAGLARVLRQYYIDGVLVNASERNNADGRLSSCPKGAVQIRQCGVAVLGKGGEPFPTACALPWRIWAALKPQHKVKRGTRSLSEHNLVYQPIYVTLSYAHDFWVLTNQINHRGRLNTTITSINDQIDLTLQTFTHLVRIGEGKFLTRHK